MRGRLEKGMGGPQPGAGRPAGPVDGPKTVAAVLEVPEVKLLDKLRGKVPRVQIVLRYIREGMERDLAKSLLTTE